MQRKIKKWTLSIDLCHIIGQHFAWNKANQSCEAIIKNSISNILRPVQNKLLIQAEEENSLNHII